MDLEEVHGGTQSNYGAKQNGEESAVGKKADVDPRGFHELAFVGEGRQDAEREVDETALGPEFDFYEDLAGDKLRLLDRSVLVRLESGGRKRVSLST